ncbi:MAG: PqqD family protein [Erythrobacter sp.]
MQLDAKFKTSDNAVSREVSGEMVLLNLESGTYFGLDTVGSRVWQIIEESPVALSIICDQIESEFDAPRELIERDIMALATDLSSQGLIELETD